MTIRLDRLVFYLENKTVKQFDIKDHKQDRYILDFFRFNSVYEVHYLVGQKLTKLKNPTLDKLKSLLEDDENTSYKLFPLHLNESIHLESDIKDRSLKPPPTHDIEDVLELLEYNKETTLQTSESRLLDLESFETPKQEQLSKLSIENIYEDMQVTRHPLHNAKEIETNDILDKEISQEYSSEIQHKETFLEKLEEQREQKSTQIEIE